MNFSKYPSIGQFRSVVKTVERQSKYTYNPDIDDWEYDISKSSPTLTFTGTVKAHGTNAGIYVDKDDTYNAQKRSSAVGLNGGHMGFTDWLQSTKVSDAISTLIGELRETYPELIGKAFVINGEWCGANIQKGVSISGLERMFLMFGIKIINEGPEENNTWLKLRDDFHSDHNINFYDIREFGTYTIDIDFNEPSRSVPKLQELTEAVEKECPIGKYFGRVLGENNTTGEGIVWTTRQEDGTELRFKVKGVAHSSSKVKKLASVNIEKLNSIQEFVDYAVTVNRLGQMAKETLSVIGDELDFDRKDLGKFLKAVNTDVVKEELDTLTENGLIMKDVGSAISKKARDWFFEQEVI